MRDQKVGSIRKAPYMFAVEVVDFEIWKWRIEGKRLKGKVIGEGTVNIAIDAHKQSKKPPCFCQQIFSSNFLSSQDAV
jgi:hypothetical protein